MTASDNELRVSASHVPAGKLDTVGGREDDARRSRGRNPRVSEVSFKSIGRVPARVMRFASAKGSPIVIPSTSKSQKT